jgi:hypothetical protein
MKGDIMQDKMQETMQDTIEICPTNNDHKQMEESRPNSRQITKCKQKEDGQQLAKELVEQKKLLNKHEHAIVRSTTLKVYQTDQSNKSIGGVSIVNIDDREIDFTPFNKVNGGKVIKVEWRRENRPPNGVYGGEVNNINNRLKSPTEGDGDIVKIGDRQIITLEGASEEEVEIEKDSRDVVNSIQWNSTLQGWKPEKDVRQIISSYTAYHDDDANIEQIIVDGQNWYKTQLLLDKLQDQIKPAEQHYVLNIHG